MKLWYKRSNKSTIR